MFRRYSVVVIGIVKATAAQTGWWKPSYMEYRYSEHIHKASDTGGVRQSFLAYSVIWPYVVKMVVNSEYHQSNSHCFLLSITFSLPLVLPCHFTGHDLSIIAVCFHSILFKSSEPSSNIEVDPLNRPLHFIGSVLTTGKWKKGECLSCGHGHKLFNS